MLWLCNPKIASQFYETTCMARQDKLACICNLTSAHYEWVSQGTKTPSLCNMRSLVHQLVTSVFIPVVLLNLNYDLSDRENNHCICNPRQLAFSVYQVFKRAGVLVLPPLLVIAWQFALSSRLRRKMWVP